MSVLAHFFESYGFSTVLVGFVKEHIEAIQPPRALWLDFPMGRPLGKPNDPEYQKKIIRSAFDLFNERSGPVLKDFPDIIPVKDGRMGYALPVELVLKKNEIGDINKLVKEVNDEILNSSNFIDDDPCRALALSKSIYVLVTKAKEDTTMENIEKLIRIT